MPLDDVYSKSFQRDAMRAELLDAETEHDLAVAWKDNRDEKALHRLINAYMRLAISMASKFRRYGVSQQDLVQEAGIGLMKAAEKFDPERGVRFSTYAQWWIKASIQDFVMRNYSMVRTGSTTNQKSLFFNLKRVKAKLQREATQRGENIPHNELMEEISTELGVPLRDVEMMDGRMMGSDFSLNAIQSADEDGREWIDVLEDDAPGASIKVEMERDSKVLQGWVSKALKGLNRRERYIVEQRKMIDEPRTLESIGTELGLSKERIRQLESAALKKLLKKFESSGNNLAQFLVN